MLTVKLSINKQPLVRILVIVASIQVNFTLIILLKTEVEKGSITTVIDYGLDGPKLKSLILFEKGRFIFFQRAKGKQVKIPVPKPG